MSPEDKVEHSLHHCAKKSGDPMLSPRMMRLLTGLPTNPQTAGLLLVIVLLLSTIQKGKAVLLIDCWE